MIKNKRVLILGKGKSGESAYELLKKNNQAEIYDTSQNDINLYNKIDNCDILIVSPGIPYWNSVVQYAKIIDKKIIGELELGYLFCKSKNIIAVTGTNGKTTTVNLIHNLLKAHNKNVFLLGNVGVPFTYEVKNIKKDDFVVLETSSFQLNYTEKFKPHVGVFLNFNCDHLNWHLTLNNYFESKCKIFQNQTEKDFAIINYDDEKLSKLNIFKSKECFFGSKSNCICRLIDNSIYYGKEKIISTEKIPLLGKHNLYNLMAAICAVNVFDLKTNESMLTDVLKKFKQSEHRLEYIGNKKGITFINDSKSTNPASTVAAIESLYYPITLILGGSDKNTEFDEIFLHSGKINKIIVTGATKQKIYETSLKFGFYDIIQRETLVEAVKEAYNITPVGGVVLFSPACASFDVYKNYSERGEYFKKAVESL